MITARDDFDARAEGMRLGVSDFLAKPVFRRQLANRIRAQLEVVATARNATDAMDRLEAASEASRAVAQQIRLPLPQCARCIGAHCDHLTFDYKLVLTIAHDHRFAMSKENLRDER